MDTSDKPASDLEEAFDDGMTFDGIDTLDDEVAELEDAIRVSGIGIEEVTAGNVEDASIVRSSGRHVIRLHRDAPDRLWVLAQALAFLNSGHSAGIRCGEPQPDYTFEYPRPETFS